MKSVLQYIVIIIFECLRYYVLKCSVVTFRGTIARITDKRIQSIDAVLKFIAVVKMYCWENAFIKRILEHRRYFYYFIFFLI